MVDRLRRSGPVNMTPVPSFSFLHCLAPLGELSVSNMIVLNKVHTQHVL